MFLGPINLMGFFGLVVHHLLLVPGAPKTNKFQLTLHQVVILPCFLRVILVLKILFLVGTSLFSQVIFG